MDTFMVITLLFNIGELNKNGFYLRPIYFASLSMRTRQNRNNADTRKKGLSTRKNRKGMQNNRE